MSDPEKEGFPLETAVLFVDLVNSSEFANVLDLKAYAEFVHAFGIMCIDQCRHFFETFHKDQGYRQGLHYEIEQSGDELAVFLHTDNSSDDVYQLVCLAISLKCAWLASDFNALRISRGLPASQLAAGINQGRVWAYHEGEGYRKRGYTINLGKRVETASRDSRHFRIFLSDPAFKRLNRKTRNLLFGPRMVKEMKGIVIPVAVCELVDSFVNPRDRLTPEAAGSFMKIAIEAMRYNTFDLWIHSCLQVWSEEAEDGVTADNLEQCKYILNLHPQNAVALYHAAQAMVEKDDPETALLYLDDLTRYWPLFGDGWMEKGRVLIRLGQRDEAARAIRQARRNGIPDAEEELPE